MANNNPTLSEPPEPCPGLRAWRICTYIAFGESEPDSKIERLCLENYKSCERYQTHAQTSQNSLNFRGLESQGPKKSEPLEDLGGRVEIFEELLHPDIQDLKTRGLYFKTASDQAKREQASTITSEKSREQPWIGDDDRW